MLPPRRGQLLPISSPYSRIYIWYISRSSIQTHYRYLSSKHFPNSLFIIIILFLIKISKYFKGWQFNWYITSHQMWSRFILRFFEFLNYAEVCTIFFCLFLENDFLYTNVLNHTNATKSIRHYYWEPDPLKWVKNLIRVSL